MSSLPHPAPLASVATVAPVAAVAPVARPATGSGGAAPVVGQPAAPSTPTAPPGALHARYLVVLTWAFTLFSAVRAVSYLPTVWAICASGDSSQHSLWTWGTWLGSNLTMALWLFEQHGQRWTRAAVVNLVNAAMCAATVTVILAYRF